MRKKHDLAGKPPSQRQLRIGEEIRHALADLFRRGDFHDPELAELNVTVTEVRISPDLRNATAFVTPLGGGPMDETLSALRRAAPFLRGQVARAINLRHAPTLSFEADTSFDYAGRIDDILHSPAVARDVGYRTLADRVNGDDDHDDEDDGWDEEDETETDDLDGDDDLDDEDDDEDEDDGDEGNGGEGEGRRGS
ncbi:ribosome-binding factor A [Azospirillum baldaniorum]|uniref:Ribosome-binding factor A n=1 Tax=Azospirillum baldaniorum TaxID=1064539 RepID=A0A9P1JN28_9PROT|nr:30S ribosome-binding factor RbfA [Azospirillum baldaniorum]TWA79936.1 ribosome-binding factor A [Azospirillum brasilense]AWJ88541.1 ribosome-binding factor A [Azospirillum baldaniorum]NUB06157.1 30S ribosome-binding factor RbfA [Azospirillum baldaniorum]TWA68505.1 ribosome-binding factor A [Azospirillum baldaniorum]CCC96523.1 ribosome-binding factor A [Azospirillum baldaniorum]